MYAKRDDDGQRLPADLLTGRLDDDTCDEPIEYTEKLQDRLEQVHQYT